MAKAKAKQPDQPARGRLLIVEDEQDLQDLLRYNLQKEGFAVSCTASGDEAVRLAQERRPDLIVLDLMLPDRDGMEVCRALKAEEGTAGIPVVILTAKGEEADVVVGLEMGADDYVTKPFSPRVLAARLKAVLRRRKEAATSESQGGAGEQAVRTGSLEIFPDRHELWVGEQRVELTATEFRLLHLLAQRPGRVFTRQQIINALHDGFAAVTDRSVDVQVVSLRRKLGDAGKSIETVRGVGYRLKE